MATECGTEVTAPDGTELGTMLDGTITTDGCPGTLTTVCEPQFVQVVGRAQVPTATGAEIAGVT